MSNVVYGINTKTGLMTICRASEKNRGKGRCVHGEHIENITPEEVQVHNEKAMETYFNTHETLTRKRDAERLAEFPEPKNGVYQTHPNGRALNRTEFTQAVNGLSDAFPDREWEIINKLADTTIELQNRTNNLGEFSTAAESVHDYLLSDDPDATMIREYLGPDIDLRDFSQMLTNNVQAMTQKIDPTAEKFITYRRYVMTALNNDMNKKRYIASVLYFGGRCCYCNRPMNRKHGDPLQATGEHITPVHPEKRSDPIGGTRFGNMVLACGKCNSTRKSQELKSWMASTDRVSEEDKAKSLERIKNFQKFALYEPYTAKQRDLIEQKLQEAIDFSATKYDKEKKGYPDIETKKQVLHNLRATVQELSETLQNVK